MIQHSTDAVDRVKASRHCRTFDKITKGVGPVTRRTTGTEKKFYKRGGRELTKTLRNRKHCQRHRIMVESVPDANGFSCSPNGKKPPEPRRKDLRLRSTPRYRPKARIYLYAGCGRSGGRLSLYAGGLFGDLEAEGIVPKPGMQVAVLRDARNIKGEPDWPPTYRT